MLINRIGIEASPVALRKAARKIYNRVLGICRKAFIRTRVRLRVQLELTILKRLENNGWRKTVDVVYDLSTGPLTYGDFTQVIMLARLLSLRGANVRLVICDEGHYLEHKIKHLNVVQIREFVAEIQSLASSLLPASVTVAQVESLAHFRTRQEKRYNYTLFHERVASRKRIYSMVPLLFQIATRSEGTQLPANFLLDFQDFAQDRGALPFSGPYIAWHLRFSQTAQLRNSTQRAIISDFIELRQLFPESSIMIFSTSEGIYQAMKVLQADGLVQAAHNQGVWVGGQPQNGFKNAIPYLLGADFYYQRLGGGMGIVPIFSAMNYLMFNADGGIHYDHGQSGQRIVPWAHRGQQFIVSQKAHSLPISDYIHRLNSKQ